MLAIDKAIAEIRKLNNVTIEKIIVNRPAFYEMMSKRDKEFIIPPPSLPYMYRGHYLDVSSALNEDELGFHLVLTTTKNNED